MKPGVKQYAAWGLAGLAAVFLVWLIIACWIPVMRLETIKNQAFAGGYATPPRNEDTGWVEARQSDGVAPEYFPLASDVLTGTCYPTAPSKRFDVGVEQNGFRELYHRQYPGRNVFTPAGLNFEHIFTGRIADESRNHFSPRKEACILRVLRANSVSLFWPAETSAWGVASEMTYTMAGGPCLDMTFRTALRKTPESDYLVYMWASYLNETRGHYVHFWGVRDIHRFTGAYYKGNIQWVRFGERPRSMAKHEDAVVPYLGVPDLEYDEEALSRVNLNILDPCAFLLPFFYGLVDGDGDPGTTGDDMVYLMMFDEAAPLRFVMFDFTSKVNAPVWDWQYVIHRPRPDVTYQYRARFIYKPFAGTEDVVKEYVSWLKGLEAPRHELRIAVEPKEGGEIFPSGLDGMYGDGVRIYFGVNPAQGWEFDHWEGAVDDVKRRYTGIKMDGTEDLRAVCRPSRLLRGCGG